VRNRNFAAIGCALIASSCGGGGGGGGGPPAMYSLGGSVTGLTTGAAVTLQTSGSSSVVVGADGAFTFSSTFANGSTYSVTVQTQPVNGTCSVKNGKGTIASADIANISVSCVQAAHSVSVASITSPTAGDFAQLSVTVKDALGNPISDPSLSWTSSDTTVVKVTRAGLLMALGPGSATVTATAQGKSGSLTINVVANPKVQPGQVLFSLGPVETVYNYATQHCATGYEIPDEPARAIRLSDGSIVLFATNEPLNFSYRGADFDSLANNCAAVLTSVNDPTAQSFRNDQWISGVYYQNGVIHALIHNEFHDPIAPTCKPGDSSPANPCGYQSTTYANSVDNGLTFTMPSAAIVAPPITTWKPPATHPSAPYYYGHFNPTNVISRNDGYLYAMVFSVPQPSAPSGECVMRTANIADATSWRGWDGAGYNVVFANPYTSSTAPADCKIVLPGALVWSVTFNSYLGVYVAIGTSCGDWYSVSSDLVNWTPIVPFDTTYYPTGGGTNPCPAPTGQLPELYGSLIDHDSTSANFDVTGQTAYLYHSRWESDFITGSQDRDLIRQPVILLKSPLSGTDFTPPTAGWGLSTSTSTAITGTFTLYPWAFDPVGIQSVRILLDGKLLGIATGGFPRPDIVAAFPKAPLDCGYQFVFDSTLYSKGAHTLTAVVTDNSQITTTLQAPIVIS
jgi:Bacterial Ig-like domain (group 2)